VFPLASEAQSAQQVQGTDDANEAAIAIDHEQAMDVQIHQTPDDFAGRSFRRHRKDGGRHHVADLGEKVAALKPVADAVDKVLEAPAKQIGNAFLDLLTVARQLRTSLSGVGVEGPLTPVPASGPWNTPLHNRDLTPLYAYLAESGSGREEVLKDAIQRKATGDLRLLSPLLDAIEDNYARRGRGGSGGRDRGTTQASTEARPVSAAASWQSLQVSWWTRAQELGITSRTVASDLQRMTNAAPRGRGRPRKRKDG